MVRGQIKYTCDSVGLPRGKMKRRVISSSKALHMLDNIILSVKQEPQASVFMRSEVRAGQAAGDRYRQEVD